MDVFTHPPALTGTSPTLMPRPRPSYQSKKWYFLANSIYLCPFDTTKKQLLHLKVLEKSMDQDALCALKFMITDGSSLLFTLNHLKKHKIPLQSEQQCKYFWAKAKPDASKTPTKSTVTRSVLKLNKMPPSPKPKLRNGRTQLTVTAPDNEPIGLVLTSIGTNTVYLLSRTIREEMSRQIQLDVGGPY